jgi:hypothetical protein
MVNAFHLDLWLFYKSLLFFIMFSFSYKNKLKNYLSLYCNSLLQEKTFYFLQILLIWRFNFAFCIRSSEYTFPLYPFTHLSWEQSWLFKWAHSAGECEWFEMPKCDKNNFWLKRICNTANGWQTCLRQGY